MQYRPPPSRNSARLACAAYPSPTDVDKSEGIQRFFPETRFVLVSLQDQEPDLRAFAILGDHIAEQEVRIV